MTKEERKELNYKLEELESDCHKLAFAEINKQENDQIFYLEDNMFRTEHEIEAWIEKKKKEWQEEAYAQGYDAGFDSLV
jgi:TolA-binding protein